MEKKVDLLMQGNIRIEKNTLQLIVASEDLEAKMKKSTSTILKGIFEGTEVSTPTCFIMVPEKIDFLRNDSPPSGCEALKEKLERANVYTDKILSFVEKCMTDSSRLKELASNAVKSTFVEESMFLYLVDEFTGKPVDDLSGIYPIIMKSRTKLFEKLLPLMTLGVAALKLAHTGTRLVNLFYPLCPVIPGASKAEAFLKTDDDNTIIEKLTGKKEGCADTQTVRGLQLRELTDFLEANDGEHGFSGLRRVCDEGSGNAIWVTEESAIRIKTVNEGAIRETDLTRKLTDSEAKLDEGAIRETDLEAKLAASEAVLRQRQCCNIM